MNKTNDIEKFFYGFTKIPKFDNFKASKAKQLQNELLKPVGSLGKLEEYAIWMAGWQRKIKPSIKNSHCLIFAGNHGIANKGVSAFPSEVTAQMVENFKTGGAAINQLCEVSGANLNIVPLSLEKPTADFTKEAAMSELELCEAMAIGAKSVNLKANLILLGEMGIGNSTISSALAASVFGGSVERWVGAGTGSDQKGQAHKTAVIELGIKKHGSIRDLRALQAFGGREQAAICGAILAARNARIPVLLDGFICAAAAAPLFGTSRGSLDHCLIGHLSVEPGHKLLLEAMGKSAILDLNMRLGEGTGAALALSIIRGAVACHNNMATFDSAGVSSK